MSYAVVKLESWQLAYVAGIIDGEGCLNLSKQSKRKDISPTIMTNMTNAKCIHLLHDMTGVGNFYEYIQPKPRKVTYRWVVRSRLEIYLLLKALQPYLLVKEKQANIMLEFVERRIQGVPTGRHDLELLEEMHKLNK